MSYLLAIAEELLKIKYEKQELDEEYRIKLQQLEARLVEIKHKCPHPSWTNYSDPSGGHDSFRICDLCAEIEYE